jgi:hypothetical protein
MLLSLCQNFAIISKLKVSRPFTQGCGHMNGTEAKAIVIVNVSLGETVSVWNWTSDGPFVYAPHDI